MTHPLVEGGLSSLEPRCELLVAPGIATTEALGRALQEVDALICLLTVPVTDDVLAAAHRLRVVANYAVGYDNIDVAAATRRGIWVCNTPGVLTEATADLTWAALLAVTRRVVEGDRLVRSGQFVGWGPTLLLGTELSGKVLGILGFGAIGQAVARRAAVFGLTVLYAERPSLPSSFDLGGTFAHAAPFEELLSRSDILSIHAPLTPETRHLLDARALGRMKRTAYLINTGRGPVVDEVALARALAAGELAGAALDVYEREPALAGGLADLPNVVLLPHLGSATFETRRRMAELAAANVRAVLEGRVPPAAVNGAALAASCGPEPG